MGARKLHRIRRHEFKVWTGETKGTEGQKILDKKMKKPDGVLTNSPLLLRPTVPDTSGEMAKHKFYVFFVKAHGSLSRSCFDRFRFSVNPSVEQSRCIAIHLTSFGSFQIVNFVWFKRAFFVMKIYFVEYTFFFVRKVHFSYQEFSFYQNDGW